VVIVTKCDRIVRKVRLLVQFDSTAPHFLHYRTLSQLWLSVVVYLVKTQLLRIFQDPSQTVRRMFGSFSISFTCLELMPR